MNYAKAVKDKVRHIINFETRVEIKPDMALVETFQDGSQLIHKRGFMIIIDSCEANITNLRLRANKDYFSLS